MPRDTRKGRGIRHFAREGGGRESRSAGWGALPKKKTERRRKKASESNPPPFEKVAILKKADTGFPDPCRKRPSGERATWALPALPLVAPALRSRLRGCASK